MAGKEFLTLDLRFLIVGGHPQPTRLAGGWRTGGRMHDPKAKALYFPCHEAV